MTRDELIEALREMPANVPIILAVGERVVGCTCCGSVRNQVEGKLFEVTCVTRGDRSTVIELAGEELS